MWNMETFLAYLTDSAINVGTKTVAIGHTFVEIEKIRRGCLINFDDERLQGMAATDLDLILQAYHSMYSGQPIFFFDEIQNVDGWANFARRLANLKYCVYVTGSNAKMLSRDIETVLGGRYLSVNVFPYSFSEFLTAVGVNIVGGWQYGRKANELQRHFRTYFEWGGFPELVNFREKRI